MLERIQRRATKIIPELKYLSYEECQQEGGLTFSKILKGMKIFIEICFSRSKQIAELEDMR